MSDVHLHLLQTVRIASPCPVRWEDMRGDDKTRHCDRCNLRVHNLSAMSAVEVGALLDGKRADPSRRVCAGYWQRADGTIMTSDCPVGFAAARVRVRAAAGRVAAAVALAVLAGASAARVDAGGRWAEWGWSMRLRDAAPVRWARQKLRPPPVPVGGRWLAGDIAMPALKTPPPPAAANGAVFGPKPM